MADFQRGSREALEVLFARYRGPLFGFFRRRLQGTERAEDLTQETFLAVIRARARYEPRALVRTYLYGIAMKLLAADRRMQTRNATETSVAEFLTDRTPEAVSGLASEPTSQATHITGEDSLWVQQALEKLAQPEREVLMLREYEQLSYAEISRLLRIPVNTVRSRLFRSRMALKALLQPEESLRSAAAGGPMSKPAEGEA